LKRVRKIKRRADRNRALRLRFYPPTD